MGFGEVRRAVMGDGGLRTGREGLRRLGIVERGMESQYSRRGRECGRDGGVLSRKCRL